MAEMRRAAAEGGSLFAEVRIRPAATAPSWSGGAPADRDRVVAIRGIIELDEAGAKVHSFGTVADVTDLRRLEHELHASQESFRAAFDRAATAMAIVDARPGREWRLLQVNRALAEMCGLTPEDMTGRSTFDFLGGADQARNTALLAKFRSGELDSVRGVDRRILRPDGQVVWVSLSTALVRDRHGDPSYFIGHLTDVTEQRRAEAEARRIAERDRRIATILQDGLQPRVEPRIAPLQAAARYLPAGLGEAIGGDWHDAFPLPGGRIGVVVGDVAGHGIEAAVTMTWLRHTARTLAASGFGPAEVLRRLNDDLPATGHGQDPPLATIVHAQFDPASDTMRYANAGHPPMLILAAPPGASQPVVRAVCALGEPALGVVSGQAYTERDTAFHPGETLIGFTDGLVERRGEDLTDGIWAIVAGLQALPHDVIDNTEALADAVLSLAPQQAGDDDATIIVLTREPDARRAAGFAQSQEISWAVSSREG